MLKKLIPLVFLYANIVIAQTSITIKGNIQDIRGTALSYANVIADPLEDTSINFTISDDEGNYRLILIKGINYHITVSYLGYQPQTIDLKAEEDINRNFILKESSEELGEVTINYTPPITIKKDTITYRTDAFTTGEERKLRDILKKLPAVEVDRAGNVTVQGKRVTKVLVEDKEFFTGDSKLAVNNIPADAVDKVQVLDNYNEVGFLKGLEDSDEMAMNIKLKKDKKKFVFGDIDVGAGIKERYLAHPALYYYSPKTTVNAIGDFNNTGNKSFTVKDYLDFEGGSNKLILDTKSYFSLLNDDFARFLGNQDFTASRNQFGALSLTQALNPTTDISSYGIWSFMDNNTRSEILNDYQVSDRLIENRITVGNQNARFGIGKLKLKLLPKNGTDITFGSYIKASNNNFNENIATASADNDNRINANSDADNISVKQDIQWHKQFSRTHTTSAVFNYRYQKATPNSNWLTDQTILQGLIPTEEEDNIDISQIKESKSHSADFVFKHYWVLNRFNHLYFTFGTQLTFDSLLSMEFQTLENGSINNFSSAGFGNNTNFNFRDISLGMHYKFQRGKVIFKPGLFYHNYNWIVNQFDQRNPKNKVVLLPELTTDVEFSSTKKLKINYNLKVRFPSISQFANGLTLSNFNSVYQGNAQLENELYHHLQARFYRFSLIKDLFYNVSASYRVKADNLKNATLLQGIDFVSSPVLSDFVDKVWSFSGSIKKGFGDYKFSLNSSVTLANYEKPVNTQIIANTSNSYSFGGSAETRFNNFPNLELKYNKNITEYSGISTSKFETDLFTAFLEYDFLKDFIFKVDYSFENYNNKTFNSVSRFDVANTSLFYQKEDSPWGFEVSGNNLFNVGFKQRNSFSSFLVSDEKTFILPRIIMFKVSYKL